MALNYQIWSDGVVKFINATTAAPAPEFSDGELLILYETVETGGNTYTASGALSKSGAYSRHIAVNRIYGGELRGHDRPQAYIS